MWLYVVIQVGAASSRVLPLGLRYRISTIISDLLWLTWVSKRRTCIENMAVVLGGAPTDRKVRAEARRAFHQFGRSIVDFLGFANVNPEDALVRDMPMKGWEYVIEGLERGKGVILATGHFGSTDMGGIALAARLGGIHAVADTFHPDYLDRLVRKTRAQKGFQLIPVSSSRVVLRALHANGFVVMLFDRPLPLDQGVPVTFFGRPTALPAGPAVMAHHTGASVVPGYIFREPDNTFRAEILPPLHTDPTLTKEENVRVITQRLAESLETAIREQPDQWYMFRQMWPEPAPSRAATRVSNQHSLAEG
jgi:lauroyl/myristoyl acyltransferase